MGRNSAARAAPAPPSPRLFRHAGGRVIAEGAARRPPPARAPCRCLGTRLGGGGGGRAGPADRKGFSTLSRAVIPFLRYSLQTPPRALLPEPLPAGLAGSGALPFARSPHGQAARSRLPRGGARAPWATVPSGAGALPQAPTPAAPSPPQRLAPPPARCCQPPARRAPGHRPVMAPPRSLPPPAAPAAPGGREGQRGRGDTGAARTPEGRRSPAPPPPASPAPRGRPSSPAGGGWARRPALTAAEPCGARRGHAHATQSPKFSITAVPPPRSAPPLP